MTARMRAVPLHAAIDAALAAGGQLNDLAIAETIMLAIGWRLDEGRAQFRKLQRMIAEKVRERRAES
jgi:hypothetical protein